IGNGKIEEKIEDGVVALKGIGFVRENGKDILYQERNKTKYTYREVEFTLIPYHMWANREPGPMVVWLFERKG
ncbi:MAG: hypothetical protein QXV17_10145, partial [Candidatus Micrarchaeaceae archaeon]